MFDDFIVFDEKDGVVLPRKASLAAARREERVMIEKLFMKISVFARKILGFFDYHIVDET